ncbi:MAG: 2-oxo acid dehydrogenase subunit E2 [Deltaproteobacteria bacterium]|nr:2-oxo acid dehydrogenase subunit E2 [Deltaproteobacteria bacterium]
MSRPFNLPDLGEGIHEGEVLAILVSVGDSVKEGDPIMEVETDKAAVEIPSPYDGKVEEIRVKPGDVVNVGDVMMTFSDGKETESPTHGTVEKTPEAPEGAAAGTGEEEAAEKPAPPPAPVPKEGPVPASPATRRLARELGVDLRAVTPTGPAGLVTAEDVRAFGQTGPKASKELGAGRPSEAPAARPLDLHAPSLPDFAKWGPIERIPVRSIRRATARQMAVAWSQIPHVTTHAEADMSKLDAFRKRHKDAVEAEGGKLTVTVFALKAVVSALRAYPNFNASLDSGAGELVLKDYHHIGVAVNTDDGLIVPVLRDVDRKSITQLAVELNDLVQRTRARKTTLEEMQGGTFTITNVGPMGGGHFSPIINFPEVSILGMGSSKMQPVARPGEDGGYEVVPRLIMPLSLCIDHRVLDGADALKFMRVVIDALEDPEKLLMTMV